MLAACTNEATSADTQRLDEYQGKTVDVLMADVVPDSVLRIVDTSITFGAEASYDGLDTPGWTILTICADAPTVRESTIVEASIVLNATASEDVLAKARAGGYEDLLVCDGLSHGAGTGDLPRPLPAPS